MEPPTNEQIVRLLTEVQAELAAARERQERLARDLTRVLERSEAPEPG